LASLRAASTDESYKEIVADIEKHLDAVKELIAVSEQSSLLSHIKRIINHLETLDGCFLLGESNRTSDTILSFESYFLYIIAEALKQNFKNSSYKDSRVN
jgi:aspartokinase/homoserine dehydrogenase 1